MSLSQRLASLRSEKKLNVSKPCFWTDEAPPFWVVKEPHGQVFAIFESIDDLKFFDALHPHVFAQLHIVEEAPTGAVRLYLGYLQ